MQGPIVIVAGTRPEAIKMMPLYRVLKNADYAVLFCSTAQHDQLLYDVLDLFDIRPDVDFGIMRLNQDLFYVTQSLLQKTKEFFHQVKPSLVCVQGDTTSTMVAALAAFYCKIPVAHIEAGLRTHDIYAPFPEEVNRKIVSTIASLHFTPTATATANLIAEGIAHDRIHCTGNTVVDALRITKELIAHNTITVSSALRSHLEQCAYKKIILFTMHRRESFDGGVARVLQTLATFLKRNPDIICFYPFHPNPHVVEAVWRAGLSALPNCLLSEPIAYQDMVYLLDHADLVLTDSGGLQEEAVSLGKQVLVLREKSERTEGITEGYAHLVATDQTKIEAHLQDFVHKHDGKSISTVYGDGYASERILAIIEKQYDIKSSQAISYYSDTKKDRGEGMKKVAVLGLGYIGLPTSIVLAEFGFTVMGVDIDEQRVAAINNGNPVIQETDLFEKLHIALQTNRFKASTLLASADYYIIAVPTPFKEHKSADLRYVFAAADMITAVLKKGDTVILESTVPVGATQQLAHYLHEKTGLVVGVDLYVAHCPERVLPGKIFHELIHNDRIIGAVDKVSLTKAQELYASFVQGKIYLTDAKTAEMVKLIENSSRDVQIAFAHQVASMAYAVGLNPYEVIELANKHPRVQILKPSCGVGGHCIAVDPWFLIETFQEQTHLLQAARNINDTRPLQVVEYIFKAISEWYHLHERQCTIALMGLTYKPDVDDIRESPALRIADMIRDNRAVKLLVCEPHLNQQKVDTLYPDAATTIAQSVQEADIIVFLVAHTRFRAIDKKLLENKKVLDFCGVLEDASREQDNLYWPASSLSFFMSSVTEQSSDYNNQQESQ